MRNGGESGMMMPETKTTAPGNDARRAEKGAKRMIRLLIIADDFTGALDTGVQFAAHGNSTRVVVGHEADFSAAAEVLVVDTETRHVPAAEAYDAVARLTREALRAGVRAIYKKTDSALRGNIGAELAAVLDASGCGQLPFLPAYPQTGRITRGGVHYVDGVPVTESPFGKDPFSPVRRADVTALIAQQSAQPACSLPALGETDALPARSGILVFDAETADDLARTGCRLRALGKLNVTAGCAGFAAVLPQLLGIDAGRPCAQPELDARLLVVCGSVNPITLAQLNAAEQAGFARLRLSPRQKLEPDYWASGEGAAELQGIERTLAAHPRCIIDTNDPGGNAPTAQYAAQHGIDTRTVRTRIAGGVGQLAGALFASPAVGTLLVTGGDTLLQCMNSIGVRELVPLCEMEKGVVLASFTCGGRTRHVITKSGGFGQEDLLVKLAARIASQTEQKQHTDSEASNKTD